MWGCVEKVKWKKRQEWSCFGVYFELRCLSYRWRPALFKCRGGRWSTEDGTHQSPRYLLLLSVCPFIHQLIWWQSTASISLFSCLSPIFQIISPSTDPSVHPPSHSSTYPFISPSFIHLSIMYPSVQPSFLTLACFHQPPATPSGPHFSLFKVPRVDTTGCKLYSETDKMENTELFNQKLGKAEITALVLVKCKKRRRAEMIIIKENSYCWIWLLLSTKKINYVKIKTLKKKVILASD